MTAIPRVLGVSSREKDPTRFALAIQQLQNGRSNATGTVTLAAGVASTTVSAVNCTPNSAVFLFAQTANAAAALPTTYVAPAAISKQQFVISHANSAQTDRTFFYVCLG